MFLIALLLFLCFCILGLSYLKVKSKENTGFSAFIANAI